MTNVKSEVYVSNMWYVVLCLSRIKRHVSFMSIKINWPCLLTPLPPGWEGGVLSDFYLQNNLLDVIGARTYGLLVYGKINDTHLLKWDSSNISLVTWTKK